MHKPSRQDVGVGGVDERTGTWDKARSGSARGPRAPLQDKGIFSEVLVYYDDEAIYFETRGENSSIVRFSFDMLATLKRVVEDKE